jgi:hypothetical protein
MKLSVVLCRPLSPGAAFVWFVSLTLLAFALAFGVAASSAWGADVLPVDEAIGAPDLWSLALALIPGPWMPWLAGGVLLINYVVDPLLDDATPRRWPAPVRALWDALTGRYGQSKRGGVGRLDGELMGMANRLMLVSIEELTELLSLRTRLDPALVALIELELKRRAVELTEPADAVVSAPRVRARDR